MKKSNVSSTIKNTAITLGVLAAAFLIGYFLHTRDAGDVQITPIFILAILIVSRFTDGYFYGIFAALISLFGVNYAFTIPYFALNFTMSGYPLTFAVMLCVSIMVSALTTRMKKQERIKAEIENEKNRANLLRAISHDIRTPLTSIIGSSSAFLDNGEKLSEASKKELVADIRDEASWLVRVVENVLSVTKINGSSAKILKEDEVVEEIIGEAARKYKKQFSSPPLETSVPDTMLFVPMDATLIEQVIFNLLENAVIHGKNATKISLSVKKHSKEAVFSVTDNGVGIEKSLLPHLFDGTFVHDKENSSDTKRNMGIGLSVCKTIIAAHGGTIRASNRKSGGARFEFSLPLSTEKL